MNKIILQNALLNHFELREKRKNIYQIITPHFHEDGDLLELFVNAEDENNLLLSDYGITFMRLTYEVDITDSKNQIITKILKENNLDERSGHIILDTNVDNLLHDVFHYCGTLQKVSSLAYLKRSQVRNFFYEHLSQFIAEEFEGFSFIEKFAPFKKHQDVIVDYAFLETRIPLYLFGIKGNSGNKNASSDKKALEIVSTCLELKQEQQKFLSAVVYEDSDSLSGRTFKRLIRVTDKPFDGLEHFKDEGKDYLMKVA